MIINKKLTKLVAGRIIKSLDLNDNILAIIFTNGSTMKIKTALPEIPTDLKLSTIKAIHQKDDLFQIEFDDNSIAVIKLAEAASSVMLRDGKGVMEYAD